jgi:hypothetical protein
MRKRKKGRPRRFGRAVLPPERFHTTKKGERGYLRRRIRKEERAERQATPGRDSQETRLAPTNLSE